MQAKKPLLLVSLLTILAAAQFTQAHFLDRDPREFPGGEGTVSDDSPMAFSLPLAGIGRDLAREFAAGNAFFRDVWVQAPSYTEARDGLGPTFNAVSCAACHFQGGRGRGIHERGLDFSILFRLSVRTERGYEPHPQYGDQLNTFGMDGVPGEARPQLELEYIKGRYADGSEYELRVPRFSFRDHAYGGDLSRARISPRIAQQLPGLGLLEAIPDSDLLTLEDPEDRDGDGISGRVAWVKNVETGERVIGRFGWKAIHPTLRQQNAGAFVGDMGITSPVFPEENCPPAQRECREAPNGGSPELSEPLLQRLTTYTQLLAIPKRRNFRDPEVARGDRLFRRARCQSCHQESFVTGDSAPFAMLRRQKIYPFTDLLLHDLGSELVDHRPEGGANGREWRASPLWGIGLLEMVSGHQNLLHDGRARNVAEAILWHGGEAAASRDTFVHFSAEEREALVKFVNSL
jgi:CxxC motif-containing protein (DUF1111 family)